MSDSFFNDGIINNIIKNYLNDNLKDYGDVIYAYAIMKKKNLTEYCVISNYPDEWVNIYKKNSYQYTDPVVIRALNSFLPFSWSEKIIVDILPALWLHQPLCGKGEASTHLTHSGHSRFKRSYPDSRSSPP